MCRPFIQSFETLKEGKISWRRIANKLSKVTDCNVPILPKLLQDISSCPRQVI